MRLVWTGSGLAVFLALAGLAWSGAAEEKKPVLDPDRPYQAQRSDAVTHTVDFSVVVTPPYHCKKLKVWLPVPQSDKGQQISGTEFCTFPQKVKPSLHTEPVFGNRFAYFEFDHPKGAQIIRHKFKAKVWTLHWNVEPKKVESVKHWPKGFGPYLWSRTVKKQNAFDRVVKSIASKSKGGAELFNVMKWIDKNLTYDHVNASLQADANHAFDQRCGHCSDYHGLCAVMGQALGYPTRVTYGLALYPKNSPSHCRVEAYLPPYGWVSFDLSETQQLIKRIKADKKLDENKKPKLIRAARARLFGGFRENSWLLLTTGTNYQLAPKAIAPVPVVRTAYIEADGEALPEPDPANRNQRRFAWMTVHHYQADRPFLLPKDYRTLTPEK